MQCGLLGIVIAVKEYPALNNDLFKFEFLSLLVGCENDGGGRRPLHWGLCSPLYGTIIRGGAGYVLAVPPGIEGIHGGISGQNSPLLLID